MARDYNAAIAALNTLQSNFAVIDQFRKSGKGMNTQAIPEMIDWCRRIGYEPSDFNKLNIVHIAGTKGKGSTSAFISSILNQYRQSSPRAPSKIGLYTSPHLRSVRERIRINGSPISEAMFTRYFFEVWDRLEEAAKRLGPGPGTHGLAEKPIYFRYLTLLMFHTYLSEGVDTAIVECGIGGEYDSTNVVQQPKVCAVTSLGIDHVQVLGRSIEEIAWHKAGIFKAAGQCKNVFTVDTQPESAIKVLEQRAADKGCQLVRIAQHPQIASGEYKLGLEADFQKTNASVAVAVASAHLRILGVDDVPEPNSKGSLPEEFCRGLADTEWGGRCETRQERNVCWYIDGGHTQESIKLAAQWYASKVNTDSHARKRRRFLLFNQQTRDAAALATQLHQTLVPVLSPDAANQIGDGVSSGIFDRALFSTNVTFSPDSEADAAHYKPDLVSINTSSQAISELTVQNSLAEVWDKLDPTATTEVHATIQSAVASIRRCADEEGDTDFEVFVTGSLHLVGGVLEVLETIKR